MIAVAGLLGLIAFVVASLVVGGRILVLASRTRRLPEFTVGWSLILAGGLGTALAVGPSLVPSLSERATYALYELSLVANHLGYVLLFLFVWRVFRPSAAWAMLLFLACSVAAIVGGASTALSLEPGAGLPGSHTPADAGFWISLTARFVGYGWAMIESFRYYALLDRRRRLGLADPTVVARFFHWGVCTAAVVCIWTTLAIQQLLDPAHPFQNATDLISALLGFVVAGSLRSAFFPRSAPGTPETTESLSDPPGPRGHSTR